MWSEVPLGDFAFMNDCRQSRMDIQRYMYQSDRICEAGLYISDGYIRIYIRQAGFTKAGLYICLYIPDGYTEIYMYQSGRIYKGR
ncbi:MAG: hypothetical protein DRI57_29480, partial [Deltaproteobacteria bacterium]